MNASNASSALSSGSSAAGTNRWNWTVSLSEIIYFGSGLILGSIFTLAMLFLRAQCKHSDKKKEEEDDDNNDNESSTGQML